MTEPAGIYRCDLNESAYPPLPEVAAILAAEGATANRYPEFLPDSTRSAIAAHLGMTPDNVVVGPGGTAVVLALLGAAARDRTMSGRSPRLSTPVPTFDGFAILAETLSYEFDGTPLLPCGTPDIDALIASVTPATAALIVCSPHNPTGAVLTDDQLRRLLRNVRTDLLVILDEAYTEYSRVPHRAGELTAEFSNLVVLRTFSKAYGLAGLRVGYAFGAPAAVARARRREVPFGVSAAAPRVVPIVLAAQGALSERVVAMRTERERLAAGLHDIGCPVLPSEANFLYLPGDVGIQIGRTLRSAGIIGREYADHGFRLTVGDTATTDHVLSALQRMAVSA